MLSDKEIKPFLGRTITVFNNGNGFRTPSLVLHGKLTREKTSDGYPYLYLNTGVQDGRETGLAFPCNSVISVTQGSEPPSLYIDLKPKE